MAQRGWDLIVVGAGSSGAALAMRSAERGKRVLLLEAGPDYRAAETPEAWRSPNPARALLDPTAADGVVWTGLHATRTDQQPPGPYWRGRGTGGSSAINGQIAIRPPTEDFDDWVRRGATGWSPEDVLPYFAKLEDDEQFGHQPHHGRGGPTPIYRTPSDEWGAVDAALSEAALAAGYPWAGDVNAPGATGVSPYPINSRDHRRVSVNDAYLEPAREWANLTVRGDALVDRVAFSGHRAVGVHVVGTGGPDAGEHRIEHADEIALCAGAIHSPTILLRSGIGPAAQLRALGLGVLAELPVGHGLQDHPMSQITLALSEGAAARSPDDRHTNVCVRYTSGGAGTNDMLLTSMNQNVLAMAGGDTGSGAFGVWVNQTHSRGAVTLSSTDPAEQPEVAERMLSDERDLSRLREGVRTLVELTKRSDSHALAPKPLDQGNEALFAALDDDAALDAHLLATAVDAQHGTSTCRMGAPDDPTTVVDPSCRVLGIDNLRVIDASIFPTVPRANTNLTAIMAGELMADRLD